MRLLFMDVLDLLKVGTQHPAWKYQLNVARNVPTSITHKSKTMNKNEIWQKILHIAITILTAIATTFGTTSCMEMLG
jgi:hypothetical protein